MRPDGYVPVDALLSCPAFNGVSFSDLEKVVETNSKQRFSLLDEHKRWWIRANQVPGCANIWYSLQLFAPNPAHGFCSFQGHSISGLDDAQMLQMVTEKELIQSAHGSLAVHGTCLSGWEGT